MMIVGSHLNLFIFENPRNSLRKLLILHLPIPGKNPLFLLLPPSPLNPLQQHDQLMLIRNTILRTPNILLDL